MLLFSSNDIMTLLSNISENYRRKLFPKISNLRGATRLHLVLESLAMRNITVKGGEGYRTKEFDFKMSDREDLRYVLREKDIIEEITNELNEESIFADIGAYHGFFTLLGNTISDQQIYSFEMNTENFKELEKNIELNQNKEKINLENKAVWSSNQKLNYNKQESQSSVGSGKSKTQSITLDSYFKNKEAPDVIKLDTEGAELEILKGAQQIHEEEETKWFIEIHEKDYYELSDYSKKDLKRFLKQKGYKASKISEDGNREFIFAY